MRLPPDMHALSYGDGWVLAREDGRYSRITRGARYRDLLLPVLHGRESPGEAVAAADPGDREALCAVLDDLEAAGLVRAVAAPDLSLGDVRVGVVGDDAVARRVLAMLPDASTTAVTPGHREGPGWLADYDVVIATADALPDVRWQGLDEMCRTRTALHLCHRDGPHLAVGPFAAAHGRPRYADLRGRRLAAAVDPGLLLADWELLASRDHPPVEPVPPAAAAAAAGLLLLDVAAHTRGDTPAGAGRQRLLHLRTGAVVEHPVLPLPLPPHQPGARAEDPAGEDPTP